MLKGIDKRDIFSKNSDYEKFVDYIRRTKEKTNLAVYAYYLMINHVHMALTHSLCYVQLTNKK